MAGTALQPGLTPSAAGIGEEVQQEIDRYLLWGCVLCGTMIMGILGVPFLVRAYRLHRRALAEGRVVRPTLVTVVGAIVLIDAVLNILMWGVDWLPAHDASVVRNMMTNGGRLTDAGYFLGYNTTPLGGTSITTEKAFQFAGMLVLYPMRVAAVWGFLKMKRWGLQYLIVNSWIYLFFLIAYVAAFTLEFGWRFPNTGFGIVGWWIINIPYFYAFLILPYLFTVDREAWLDVA
jgi:hypothetical protein